MRWIPKQFPKIKTTKALMNPRNNIMVGAYILSGAMQGTNTPHQTLYKYLGRRDKRYADKILSIAGKMSAAAGARK